MWPYDRLWQLKIKIFLMRVKARRHGFPRVQQGWGGPSEIHAFLISLSCIHMFVYTWDFYCCCFLFCFYFQHAAKQNHLVESLSSNILIKWNRVKFQLLKNYTHTIKIHVIYNINEFLLRFFFNMIIHFFLLNTVL